MVWVFDKDTKEQLFECNFTVLPLPGHLIYRNGFGYRVEHVIHRVVTKNTTDIQLFVDPLRKDAKPTGEKAPD